MVNRKINIADYLTFKKISNQLTDHRVSIVITIQFYFSIISFGTYVVENSK